MKYLDQHEVWLTITVEMPTKIISRQLTTFIFGQAKLGIATPPTDHMVNHSIAVNVVLLFPSVTLFANFECLQDRRLGIVKNEKFFKYYNM